MPANSPSPFSIHLPSSNLYQQDFPPAKPHLPTLSNLLNASKRAHGTPTKAESPVNRLMSQNFSSNFPPQRQKIVAPSVVLQSADDRVQQQQQTKPPTSIERPKTIHVSVEEYQQLQSQLIIMRKRLRLMEKTQKLAKPPLALKGKVTVGHFKEVGGIWVGFLKSLLKSKGAVQVLRKNVSEPYPFSKSTDRCQIKTKKPSSSLPFFRFLPKIHLLG
jgi:hypothetical protein